MLSKVQKPESFQVILQEGLLIHIDSKTGSSRGDMKRRLNNFSLEEVVLETPRKESILT